MSLTERYRALVEARHGSPGEPSLAQSIEENYLHAAALHAPGGRLVYSRARIADFLRARIPSHDVATAVRADVLATPVPTGTLLAARVVSGSDVNRELALSMALMRGRRINEEWLFEAPPGRREAPAIERVMLDLALPAAGPPVGAAKTGLDESGLESNSSHHPLADRVRDCLNALQRACLVGDPGTWLQEFARDLVSCEIGGITAASGRSFLDTFYRDFWARFNARAWFVQRVEQSTDGRLVGVLWRLAGTRFDGTETLGATLPGLTIWEFDDSGCIKRESTIFDEAALECERLARAAAWKP